MIGPNLPGACADHPVCGAVEPLTQAAVCRNRQCGGTHQSDGGDAWTESTEENNPDV